MIESIGQDGRPTFEIRNLRGGYVESGLLSLGHRRVVVDGVSFSFRGGDVIGIVGANASGKSTLIRSIVDERRRFGGEVLCDGDPLRSSQIAYVPQSPALTLAPWRSVFSELALPLRIRGVPESLISIQVNQRVRELGLSMPLNRPVGRTSGGQRARIAVGRALLTPEHRLLVCDEPFEGLDEPSRLALLSVIRRAASDGVAVIVTSHRSEDLVALNARLMCVTGTPIRELVERRISTNYVESDPSGSPPLVADGLTGSTREQVGSSWKHSFSALASTLVALVLGMAVWGLVAKVISNASILPGPIQTARSMAALLTSKDEATHLGATLLRATVCWGLAVVSAVPLGILAGANPRVFLLLSPWLSWGRCVPIFAMVGSAIGLFPGHPEVQRSFLIWLTLFLICLQIVAMSAAMAPRHRVDLARIFGASPGYRLWRVLLPESMAGVISALEVSLPISIIVTLVVETTMLPNRGVGLYVFNHMTDRDLSMMFAYVLLPGAAAAAGVWMIRVLAKRVRIEL